MGSTCWSVATSLVFSSTLGTFFQGWLSKTFCLKLYICWFLNCFLFCPREGLAGKDGVTYSQHGALCLETQVLICIISQTHFLLCSPTSAVLALIPFFYFYVLVFLDCIYFRPIVSFSVNSISVISLRIVSPILSHLSHCLIALQNFPDFLHQSAFPKGILRPGEVNPQKA